MKMKFIDFRFRPPAKSFLDSYHYQRAERTANTARKLGLAPPPSLLSKSMEDCLREMDAAGYAMGVLVGRRARMGIHVADIANDDIAALIREHPGRFAGYASVDLHGGEASVAELRRAAGDLGLQGLAIDPGYADPPLYCDDRALYPLYETCRELGIPALIMAGGNVGPDLSYTFPVHFDRVAADFPDLALIAAHGGWPWTVPFCHIAFRRPNVYLSPDMYLINAPGARDYVQAANSYLQDRFLYATAYPSCPMGEYVEAFLRLPWKPEVLEKICYRNAARLLGREA